jgi:hypothetical protein
MKRSWRFAINSKVNGVLRSGLSIPVYKNKNQRSTRFGGGEQKDMGY